MPILKVFIIKVYIIMHFIFQFGEFTTSESSQFWKSFIPLFAPAVAFYIFYLTQKRTKEKEAKQKVESENKKIIFLDFLIKDIDKIIVRFNDSLKKVKANYAYNPFILSDFPFYPDFSLNLIVNEINQEDYYYACLNRLKPNNIGEIFLMISALYTTNRQVIEHHRREFQPRIDSKEKVDVTIKSLERLVRQYVVETPPDPANVSLVKFTNLINHQPQNTDYNSRLFQSLQGFTLPVISIIVEIGEPALLRPILNQAYDARDAYNDCYSHMTNVVNFFVSREAEINGLARDIKQISQPLTEYINGLDIQPIVLLEDKNKAQKL